MLVTIQEMRLAPRGIAFSIFPWVPDQQINANMWDVWISYFGISLHGRNNYSSDHPVYSIVSQWTVNGQVT